MLKMCRAQISDSFPFGKMELLNIIYHSLWKRDKTLVLSHTNKLTPLLNINQVPTGKCLRLFRTSFIMGEFLLGVTALH